jgi:AhpD family alkylhydroperoxidase
MKEVYVPAKFTRRTYHNVAQFWADVRSLGQNRMRIQEVMRGSVTLVFRERLMMAVTAVNQCRYCSYYHAHEALAAGIPAEEINQLLGGSVAAYEPHEAVALLYAQHWAESDANPDPVTKRRLVDTYGADRASDIELVLRLIRFGNLCGNTFDYILYRITGGRCGLSVSEQHLLQM